MRLKTKFFATPQIIAMAGNDILATMKFLVSEAKTRACLCYCEINNTIILVQGDSDPELLARDQMRSQMGLIPQKIIGPYPERNLSEKDQKAHDNWHLRHR